MENAVAASPRRQARLAGAFYLITIVTGVFAEMFSRGALVVRDGPGATATNILAHESLYRLGLGADLVMLGAYIAVTGLFYQLFKPAGRGVALAAAFFSLIGIAVLAANCLNHVAPLLLLGNEHYLSAFTTDQLQGLALIALKLHARGYLIAGEFFGAYCMMIGYLAFRSGFLPRMLGALMAAGGLGYLIDSSAFFLFPAISAALPDLSMIGGIAELVLSLWLIVMGVDAAKWAETNRAVTAAVA